MRLSSLSLRHFRSYSSLELDLSDGNVHLFMGENGSGKTNLLEAISILSLSKSCFPREEEELITWGADFYGVRATAIADSTEERSLEIVSQLLPRRQKACFSNDVRVTPSQVVGTLPTVIFLPQDLQLFTGPPGERRRFLDQILCQGSPEYFQALSEYQKIVKQRNTLLKNIIKGLGRVEDLEPWDVRAAERGSLVTLMRLELVETFGMSLAEELRTLGERWANVTVAYDRDGSARTKETIQEEMVRMLFDARDRDILLQSTSVGPHREDWTLVMDGHPVASFASRGQQRIAVLALLFLEASYLELRRGEKPVILLDDVFSELDDHHQASVLRSFADHQVLMTTVHVPDGIGEASVWDVRLGSVESRAFKAVHAE